MPLPQLQLYSKNTTARYWVREGLSELFDLHAPYQRGSVWTTLQKQNLIKSLYMGIPTGNIVLSELPVGTADDFHYRVIDGKQRIEAMRSWVAGEFSVPREWFADGEVSDEAQGFTDVAYAQMSDKYKRNLEMSVPMPHLNFDGRSEWLGRDSEGKAQWRKRSEEEILKAEAEVYLLINFAGTAQSLEDFNHANEFTK